MLDQLEERTLLSVSAGGTTDQLINQSTITLPSPTGQHSHRHVSESTQAMVSGQVRGHGQQRRLRGRLVAERRRLRRQRQSDHRSDHRAADERRQRLRPLFHRGDAADRRSRRASPVSRSTMAATRSRSSPSAPPSSRTRSSAARTTRSPGRSRSPLAVTRRRRSPLAKLPISPSTTARSPTPPSPTSTTPDRENATNIQTALRNLGTSAGIAALQDITVQASGRRQLHHLFRRQVQRRGAAALYAPASRPRASHRPSPPRTPPLPWPTPASSPSAAPAAASRRLRSTWTTRKCWLTAVSGTGETTWAVETGLQRHDRHEPFPGRDGFRSHRPGLCGHGHGGAHAGHGYGPGLQRSDA